jgi:diguanylate cyclase
LERAAAGHSPAAMKKPVALPEDKKLRFVRHMRNMRVLGLALGSVCVAAALHTNGAAPWLWALLLVTCAAWPPFAYRRARRAPNPVDAEFHNLAIDAVIGGFWVAAMGANLLPSVLLLTMLWIGDVAAGGARLLVRCVMLQAGAGLAAWLAFDFGLHVETTMLDVVACVPFLVVYPVALSLLVRGLNGKVQRQKRLLERLVSTDGLTGLANRQHWEWWVEQHLARVARGEGAAALMMIDVDHFKSVNDTYGHLLGDEVVTTVAQTLRATLRENDVAGRYAGDEFAVVMPATDVAAAREVAENLRRRVAALRFPGAPALRTTLSIGIAIADGDATGVNAWIHAADHAMYQSKRAGRDRATVAAAAAAAVPEPALRRAG